MCQSHDLPDMGFLTDVVCYPRNQFARRISGVTGAYTTVYDSGIKMYEYMMAGLNAAFSRHTMFTGVILWRMAPWPYTLKACDVAVGCFVHGMCASAGCGGKRPADAVSEPRTVSLGRGGQSLLDLAVS
jgi:hypothetical protein